MTEETPAVAALSDGGDGLIVAVDFGGAREEAGFPDLVPNLPDELGVVATLPTVDLTDPPPEVVQRQLESWKDAIHDTGGRVVAVMGYCAGASIATRLAGDLAAEGAPAPGLVLLDPSWATRDLLLSAYESSTASLVEALGETAPSSADLALLAPAPEEVLDDDALVRLAQVLRAEYARTATRVATALDLPPELMDDLVERFHRYLSYIVVACTAADPLDAARLVEPSRTLTIASATHPAAELVTPGLEVRTELPRAELLADPDVAQTVTEFLNEVATE